MPPNLPGRWLQSDRGLRVSETFDFVRACHPACTHHLVTHLRYSRVPSLWPLCRSWDIAMGRCRKLREKKDEL